MNSKFLKYIVVFVLLLAVAITNINAADDFIVASDVIWPHGTDNVVNPVITVASDVIWPHGTDNVVNPAITVASDVIWPHGTNNVVNPNGTGV